jgi:hypothetical protein
MFSGRYREHGGSQADRPQHRHEPNRVTLARSGAPPSCDYSERGHASSPDPAEFETQAPPHAILKAEGNTNVPRSQERRHRRAIAAFYWLESPASKNYERTQFSSGDGEFFLPPGWGLMG